MRRWAWLVCLLGLGGLTGAAGASPTCSIVEGVEIGGLRLGMPASAALALTGPPLEQHALRRQVIYTLRAPWSSMTVEDGVVRRIATRSPGCRSATRVGPGSTLKAVQEAYASATASVTVPVQDGDLLSYPFEGIAFVIRRGRVASAEVFPKDIPTASTADPRAAATPAGWTIRTAEARVDGTVLIVTGTVENRTRAMLAYVEVNALDDRGRKVATGDSPLDPNPVPHGATATFEARLTVEDVVRRYVVTLRPLGAITGSLADRTGEIRDRQQFSQVVMRKLQAAAQPAAGPPRVVVEVRNGSVAAVAAVALVVDYETRCFVPTPRPGRFIVNTGTGVLAVGQIPAGGVSQAALAVSTATPGCENLLVLAARARITDVKIAD